MNVYIWKEKLPSAYQEVEWIQNSGTQYIKTSLNICTGYRQVMKVRFLNTLAASSYPGLAGGYLGQSGSTYYRLYLCGLVSNNTFQVGFMGNHYDNKGSAVVGTDYEIDFSRLSGNLYFKIDGTTIQTSSETWSTSLAGKACLLGTYSQDSNPQYRANPGMRLYYSKFYNSNGDLVGDFVPCYRKSDNVIGMYDLVNNQFYTNAGSGTFSKGNNVSYMEHELKNAYIGEYSGGLVFDFQNNGLSGCTLNGSTYASIVAGEGISMSGTTSYNYGVEIALPSSAYGKAIKQVILNCYYPTSGYGAGKGFGCLKNSLYSFRYSREEYEQNNIGFADGQTTAQNIGLITGEITITMNFGDGVISGTVNNTSFSVSNSAANGIRDSFIDGTFRLLMVSWRTSVISYLRKATIITE